MAKFYAKDFSVTIGAVDLSSSINSVELTLEADDIETTTFGSSGYRTRIAGLATGSLKIDFMQDYGAGAVEATLAPLFGTNVAFTIKPTSAAVGTANPSYSGTAVVVQATPVSGAVGDLSTFSVQWPLSGSVTKATA